MAGIFTTFNTARRGLYAQQAAVDTASHNVANASTAGYSRQRVQMSATSPYNSPGVGQIGTGVEVSLITRIRDSYLDLQIRGEKGILGEYGARQEVLEQVEMIFMEPSDTGLSATMAEMWNAWQELSKSPENSNARTIVVQSAQTFADQLNHMDEQLTTLKEDAIHLVEKKVYDSQSIFSQVNSLNDQISRIVAKGDKPNDLLDQRDLLLDQLSSITDFTTEEGTDGRITIKIDGKEMTGSNVQYQMSIVRDVETIGDDVKITLVRGGDTLEGVQTFTISKDEYEANYKDLKAGEVIFNKTDMAKSDPLKTDLQLLNDGAVETFSPNHGELMGYYSIQKEVDSYKGQLDNLAEAIAGTVNMIHQAGDDTQMAFFLGDSDGITAKNIKVNSEIVDDVYKINAGEKSDSPTGDGSRALAIAQLRNGRFTIHNFDKGNLNYDAATMKIDNQTGGTTFDSYYKDIVAKLGISSQQAGRMVDNQESLLGQLQQRRESISGVSIDEEIANLVQYQHAYEANSKVIATLTDMLDTLINRMGV